MTAISKKQKLPAYYYTGWVNVFRRDESGVRYFSHQQRVGGTVVHAGTVESLGAALSHTGSDLQEFAGCDEIRPLGEVMFATKKRREVV